MRCFKRLKASLVACLFCWAGVSLAGGLQISPVKLHLSKAHPVTSFTITNASDKDVVLQGEIKSWRQDGEKNVYKDSRDLILAPPIITIASHQTQIFRVALRGVSPEPDELSYRLYLQEVVPQAEKDAPGLHFALRIGLPVFVAPVRAMAKNVTWKVVRDKKALKITAVNKGNTHVQISHLLLGDESDKKPLVDKNVFRYLLPHKSYTWTVPTEKKAQDFMQSIKLSKLKVTTDTGIISQDFATT